MSTETQPNGRTPHRAQSGTARRRWHGALTLADVLVRASEARPDAPAVIFADDRRTYRELEDRAVRAARSLAALGVGKGSHVGLLMPNCLDFVEVFFGAALLGAVVVPINARFKGRELGHVLGDGDVEVLVTSDIIEQHVDYVGLLHEVVPGLSHAPDPAALDLPAMPRLRAAVLLGSTSPRGFLDREAFDALAERTPVDRIDEARARVAIRDAAIMVYTSGTTAMPKGCVLSHEALVRTSIVAGSTRYRLRSDDRFWDPLPMFHMSAILPLIGCFDVGAAFVSMTHFDADTALRMIDEEHATIVFATFPAITMALLNHPEYHPDRWEDVRLVNNVGPPDVLRAMQERMPHAVQVSAYGCTECGGVIAFGDPDDTLEQRTNTCGPAFDGIEVEIRDIETGEPVATGEPGEIVVRGYCVFEGYYKDPALTSARIDADGWFHTGDICSLDDEGRISYRGRTKDMLKVGGENVAALEIEAQLGTHEAVSIACVVGVPDPKYMEVPAAFVELKPGHDVSAEELIAHCRRGLARFKVPQHVRFVTEWPMSATKIQKFRLAEQLARELEAERSDDAARGIDVAGT
jgi:fatty-acyl-CoA synthase